MLFRRRLPDLLEADSECRNVAVLCQIEPLQKNSGEAAAGALGEQGVFRSQFHAASETVLVRAVLADPHIAGCNACNRAILIEQNLRRCKARINLYSEGLSPGRKIFAYETERTDETAVIAH